MAKKDNYPKFEKLFKKGLTEIGEGKMDDALVSFEKTLKIDPMSVNSLINISVIHLSKGDYEKAEEVIRKAIMINPNYPETYLNLGVIYRETQRVDSAIEMYKKVLKLKPDYAEVLGNMGACFRDKNDLKSALKYFKKAVKADPNIADFYFNIGNVYGELGKNRLSEKYYGKAIDKNPNFFNAYYNLGVRYQDSGKLDQAAEAYMNVLKINPFYEDAWGNLAVLLSSMCRWDLLEKVKINLAEVDKKAIEKGRRPGELPFFSITRRQDLEYAKTIAKAWSDELSYSIEKFKPEYDFSLNQRPKNKRIKLGFISDGFRKFPTAQNLLGVLENIDRKRFEVILYSYGVDDKSVYRKRSEKLADSFVDISKMGFLTAAKTINDDNIDILFDLKGYSRGNRIKIIALHPARIVVSFLGFAGTTGSSFVDYIIADKTTIPTKDKKFYSERIAYMPDSYWPTDDKLKISAKKFSKKDVGIKDDNFVFASFNQSYKITPEIFESWINILRSVPNSVLLLWNDNDSAIKNLRERFEVAQLSKDRLLFAETLPKADHLARLRDTVDLGLDTDITNGHTTTTDCLWVGVPIVTVQGKHFMSRVSSSMLQAVGLPELITTNLSEYEKLAIKLATNKKQITSYKQKLQENIKTYPLFDTEKYTRNFEKLLLTIYEKQRSV